MLTPGISGVARKMALVARCSGLAPDLIWHGLTQRRMADARYAEGYLGQAGLLPGLSAFGLQNTSGKKWALSFNAALAGAGRATGR